MTVPSAIGNPNGLSHNGHQLSELCLKHLAVFLTTGSWHPQKDSPHHRHLRRLSPSQQIHRISSGQRAATEGVPLQAHPVPQEGFCSQEGRQLGKILLCCRSESVKHVTDCCCAC